MKRPRHEKPAPLTNINSSLLFVPRQNPYLDVGLHQGLDGLRHLVLELVLDGRGAQQLQVLHPDVSKSRREEKEASQRRSELQRRGL